MQFSYVCSCFSDLHDQQEHPAISFRFSADRRFLLSEGTLLEVCGAVIGV